MGYFVLKTDVDSNSRGYATNFQEMDDSSFGDTPRCSECLAIIGHPRWLPPHKVQIEMLGKNFGDLAFGPVAGMLVSEKFKVMYESNDLAGISVFEPVEVVDIRGRSVAGKKPPQYYYAYIEPGAATIDAEASGLKTREPISCTHCRSGYIEKFDRVSLSDAPDGGQDIFTAKGLPGLLIVTQKFKQACLQAEITNAVFIDADSYGENFESYQG